MDVDKLLGVYYTPKILTDFVAKHLLSYHSFDKIDELDILEPSVGMGEFIFSLLEQPLASEDLRLSVDSYDVDTDALRSTEARLEKFEARHTSLNYHNKDFLFASIGQYDLIVGNPPYISRTNLTKQQIEQCEKITQEVTCKDSECRNIWPAFVFKAIKSLKNEGTICFVVPSELLQVKHTQSLRDFLIETFQRIEIFSFKEIIFDRTQQDVVLLIASNSTKPANKGVSFYEVEKLEDLTKPDYLRKYSNVHRKNPGKWSNYILSDEELDFLQEVEKKIDARPIASYCDKVQVGIVTAANKYFIVPKSIVEEFTLQNHVLDIVQKNSYLNGHVKITGKVIKEIEEGGLPTSLIRFPDVPEELLPEELIAYKEIGETEGINDRYKMKKRTNWYTVPIGWKGDCLFAKRTHNYPKVILNSARTHATDAFYKMRLRTNVSKYSLFGSFYNTFTFIDCELKGRYYGGGVLEMTPNEFKQVKLPYISYTLKEANIICSEVGLMEKTRQYYNKNDAKVLSSLDSKELEKLHSIYLKLLNRRRRK